MTQKCSAKTKHGDDCRAPAVIGSVFCAMHGNPERAAELGRMGGLKNRHYIETEPVTINPPATPEDVKNVLGQALVDMRAKKLDPRTGTAITYMSRVLLEAFDSTDLQQRLARIEEQLRTKADKS